MWGPNQSPFILAWINFINSINWNYKIKVLFILKRFKTKEVWKLFARRKYSNKILLKMRFLSDPKNSKDENLKNK